MTNHYEGIENVIREEIGQAILKKANLPVKIEGPVVYTGELSIGTYKSHLEGLFAINSTVAKVIREDFQLMKALAVLLKYRVDEVEIKLGQQKFEEAAAGRDKEVIAIKGLIKKLKLN